jgi:type I restriction enzyme S subunit
MVGRKGSAGEINWAEAKSWPIDTTYYVNVIDGRAHSLDFIYYLLKWLDPRRFIDTTTKPGLNRDRVYEQTVPVPPLPVQERIVQILQKADEIRRKREDALQIADAILPPIFNDMFGTPDANPHGYVKTTVGKVTDLVTSGYTPRGGARNYIAEGPLLIRSQNVRMLHLDLSDCAHLPESIHDEMSRVRVLPGDVLLNITGASIGRVAWAGEDIPPSSVNQHVCIIRTQRDVLAPEYLAYCLATPWYQHIILNAPGSAQTGFNHARVRALEILVPPMPVQRSFVGQVETLRQARDKCVLGLDDITTAFQTLMAQAFTGQLTAEWEAANANWIAAQVELHEGLPRLLLLALIRERAARAEKAAQAAVLVTALMKYAFLLQMEGNGRRRFYHFVPYHYGPFAKELYADLERLQADGLVTVDNDTDEDKTRITLADAAHADAALADLPDVLKEDVASILDAYGDLDHKALLKTVYDKYPAYAKKSRIARKRNDSDQ